MRAKSSTRSIAGLSFSVIFLLAAFVPAWAQADEPALSDSKTAVSKLSVSPKSLSYNVNLDKGVLSETKHFHITNEGTVPLKVVMSWRGKLAISPAEIDWEEPLPLPSGRRWALRDLPGRCLCRQSRLRTAPAWPHGAWRSG